MVADGISGGNGGFYGKVIESYHGSVGKSGMSKSEISSSGRQVSSEYRQAKAAETTNNNIAKLQQAAGMYGLKLDSSSIFAMADTNGSGIISDKEATAAMTKLGQMAQMNAMSGGSSGGSGVMGMLNSITDTAGNIAGLAGGNSGGGSSGLGGIVNTAVNAFKGIFG